MCCTFHNGFYRLTLKKKKKALIKRGRVRRDLLPHRLHKGPQARMVFLSQSSRWITGYAFLLLKEHPCTLYPNIPGSPGASL